MTPERMRAHAGQASALLKVMSNEDRLLLLCQLVEQRLNVSELEKLTGIRQPSLSQQLAILREEKLVATVREGRYVYYRLANDDVMRIMRTLWDIYCSPEEEETES